MVELIVNTKLDAKTDEEVISSLSQQMEKKGYVKPTYKNAVLARERELPTGLKGESIGIAIPHTDNNHVNQLSVSIATLANPVTFQLMEDPSQNVDVEVVFLLAVSEPKDQTMLLKAVMGILKDNTLLTSIRNAESEETLKVLLDQSILAKK
ncbi:PTS sugar transporter subunit IIA [Oceanobacillus locisalsi]|uniref:PTS sugar transporter subunit IIA n=1 Tax=Oceanobacillus locisalsi TaxID=546107 RepID=A0ABW3NB33_9BACI